MNIEDTGKNVIIGKIGAPYGVQGWVKIHSFTNPKSNLFTYPLLLEASQNWLAVKIDHFKPHGDGFVAKLADISDRNQAALITNLNLAVTRDNLPELDTEQYYLTDLIGLTVYNEKDIELGQVADFFETGANDVIVVKSGKKEHLIPFVLDMYVLDIDLTTKQIRVLWDAEF